MLSSVGISSLRKAWRIGRMIVWGCDDLDRPLDAAVLEVEVEGLASPGLMDMNNRRASLKVWKNKHDNAIDV